MWGESLSPIAPLAIGPFPFCPGWELQAMSRVSL